MPSNYDNTQTSSIINSMYNYFVASILTKWFKIVNKEEAEAYAIDATAMLNDVKSKLYNRTRPKRPNYD
jgi:hypothetical protein